MAKQNGEFTSFAKRELEWSNFQNCYMIPALHVRKLSSWNVKHSERYVQILSATFYSGCLAWQQLQYNVFVRLWLNIAALQQKPIHTMMTQFPVDFYHKVLVIENFDTWRHQIETFSTLLALCEGNPPVIGEFPSQRPVMRSFGVYLICAWTNGWANDPDAGNLRRNLKRHCGRYSSRHDNSPDMESDFWHRSMRFAHITFGNKVGVASAERPLIVVCGFHKLGGIHPGLKVLGAFIVPILKNIYLQLRTRTLLTHLPLDKLAAISQTTFSNAFSWMKHFVFQIDFHWSWFLRV